MALGMVLDPTARRTDDIASPGPDAGVLAGNRIGMRLDQIWRSWDWISEMDVILFVVGGLGGLHAAALHGFGSSPAQTVPIAGVAAPS